MRTASDVGRLRQTFFANMLAQPFIAHTSADLPKEVGRCASSRRVQVFEQVFGDVKGRAVRNLYQVLPFRCRRDVAFGGLPAVLDDTTLSRSSRSQMMQHDIVTYLE